MKFPHLAAHIFNTPLLIHPQKLDAIIAGLGGRLLGAPVADGDGAPKVFGLPAELTEQLPAELFTTRRGERADSGYMVTEGVAVITAGGALVHRSRLQMADSSFLLGYNTLAAQLEAAMDDPNVHAVAQVWDSPGGEVAGAFEYADRVFAQRGRKPMWAIADTMAASAAYLGGSAFDRLYVASTGYAGSIGVVMRHVDMSGALAQDGLRVTQIYAGAHKVDGHPFGPLPPSVLADAQAEIDALYEQFIAAVSRQTGLSPDAVRATQARTYRAQAAVDAGLAFAVSSTDALISELAAQRARLHPAGHTARSTATTQGGSLMSGNSQGGQPAAQTPPTASAVITPEQLEAARAEGHASGVQEGQAQGRAAELARVQAVFAEGKGMKGHEALVMQLALDGKTTGPEAAQAILAAERSHLEAAARAHAADAPAAAPAAAAPAGGGEGQGKSREQLAADAKAYAAEHKVTFVDACKALGIQN